MIPQKSVAAVNHQPVGRRFTKKDKTIFISSVAFQVSGRYKGCQGLVVFFSKNPLGTLSP